MVLHILKVMGVTQWRRAVRSLIGIPIMEGTMYWNFAGTTSWYEPLLEIA